MIRWFKTRVMFLSWHRHWKGIYLHFIPRYTVRLSIDWTRKQLQ